jgi:hypothetical protein
MHQPQAGSTHLSGELSLVRRRAPASVSGDQSVFCTIELVPLVCTYVCVLAP